MGLTMSLAWRKLLCAIVFLFGVSSVFALTPYGEKLCHQPDYTCRKIKRGDSWGRLFPDALQRDLVKRVNRTNRFLHQGMVIAVPKQLFRLTLFDVSPFPLYRDITLEDTIYVDQQQQAFGAYNKLGQLVWWGPVSSGALNCPEADDSCLTPVGSWLIRKKQGLDCVSSTWPRLLGGRRGGGAMPWCLRFYRGFSLHGSDELPGYPDSHGCIRLLMQDARWLNEVFAHAGQGLESATRVVVVNAFSPVIKPA